MTSLSTTRIDLLRHGACEGGEIFRGRTDVPLSAKGRAQMNLALCTPEPWTQVYTSPLQRCARFAQDYAAQHALPCEPLDDLREMDFGHWDGRNKDEIWREYEDQVKEFYRDPETFSPPGGESTQALQVRVLGVWHRLLRQQASGRLLVVTHGGVLRVLLSHVLQVPLANAGNIHLPYAVRLSIAVTQHGGRQYIQLVSLTPPPEVN